MRSKLFIIGVFVLLMLGGIFVIGTSLKEERKDIMADIPTSGTTAILIGETAVFKRSDQLPVYQKMPAGKRRLETYYENRAYTGAPPSIPHPLVSEKGIGGKACLQCHQNGGYVKQFDAFAPVTPHPEMLNCRQCHLPEKTKKLFQNTNWQKAKPPAIHQAALKGSPPVIPHTLQMRENCLACHAGAAAPLEIRVSHPERINCRQCHLLQHTQKIFDRNQKLPKGIDLSNSSIGQMEKRVDKKKLDLIKSMLGN